MAKLVRCGQALANGLRDLLRHPTVRAHWRYAVSARALGHDNGPLAIYQALIVRIENSMSYLVASFADDLPEFRALVTEEPPSAPQQWLLLTRSCEASVIAETLW